MACNKENKEPVQTCESCNFDCADLGDEDVFTNDCVDNFECTFAVTSNSKVNTNESMGLDAGDKNVFQIVTSTEGDAGIADDEFENILVFELEENQESFDADGNDLELLKTNFRRICFCTDTDFREVKDGCMQGMKAENGDWFVQGNLEIEYSWGIQVMKFDVMIEN